MIKKFKKKIYRYVIGGYIAGLASAEIPHFLISFIDKFM